MIKIYIKKKLSTYYVLNCHRSFKTKLNRLLKNLKINICFYINVFGTSYSTFLVSIIVVPAFSDSNLLLKLFKNVQ